MVSTAMESTSKWLAPGAIIAYAVAGSVLLFVFLSSLFILILRLRQRSLHRLRKARLESPLLTPHDQKTPTFLPVPPICMGDRGQGFSLSEFEELPAPESRSERDLGHERPHSGENLNFVSSNLEDHQQEKRISWPLRSSRSTTAPFLTTQLKSPLSAISESPRSRSASTPESKEVFELPADSKLTGLQPRMEKSDDSASEAGFSSETIWPTIAGEISRPRPKGPRNTIRKGKKSPRESKFQDRHSDRNSADLSASGRSLSHFTTKGPKRRKKSSGLSASHISHLENNFRRTEPLSELRFSKRFSADSQVSTNSLDSQTGLSSTFTKESRSVTEPLFDSPASAVSSYTSDGPSYYEESLSPGNTGLKTGLSTPSFSRARLGRESNPTLPKDMQRLESDRESSDIRNSVSRYPSYSRRRSSSLISGISDTNWAYLYQQHTKLRNSNAMTGSFTSSTDFGPRDELFSTSRKHRHSQSHSTISRPVVTRKGTFGSTSTVSTQPTLPEWYASADTADDRRPSGFLFAESYKSHLAQPKSQNQPISTGVRPISDLKSAQGRKPGHRRHRSLRGSNFIPHDINSTVVMEAVEDRSPSPQKLEPNGGFPFQTQPRNSDASPVHSLSLLSKKDENLQRGRDLLYSPTLSIYNYYHASGQLESSKSSIAIASPATSDDESDHESFFSVDRPSSNNDRVSAAGLKTRDMTFPVSSTRRSSLTLWPQPEKGDRRDITPEESRNIIPITVRQPSNARKSRKEEILGPRDQPSKTCVRKSILELRRMDSEAQRWKSARTSEMYLSMGSARNISPSIYASEAGDDESVYESVYVDSPRIGAVATNDEGARNVDGPGATGHLPRTRQASLSTEKTESMYDKDGFLKF